MRHEMLTQRAPFCIGMMAKKGTLSHHLVTHVVPPLIGWCQQNLECGQPGRLYCQCVCCMDLVV